MLFQYGMHNNFALYMQDVLRRQPEHSLQQSARAQGGSTDLSQIYDKFYLYYILPYTYHRCPIITLARN